MSNLIKFDDFNDSSIRVTDDGRYSVFDLIRFCGKKNPWDAWKALTQQYPELVECCQGHQFPGRGQKETPVADIEVADKILCLLGVHPLQEHVTSEKFYPRTEKQINKILIAAFYDCEPCEQFFCQGYRIDLYLAKPRIAVECDEHGHGRYTKKSEQVRHRKIKQALGCSFVRFDPYDADFNLGDVIASVRGLL